MLYVGLPVICSLQSVCCVLYRLNYGNACYYSLQTLLSLVHMPKAIGLCFALYGYEMWSDIQERTQIKNNRI
jgi:hypothetical protein